MVKQTRINWENKIKHPIKGRHPDEFQPVVKAKQNEKKKKNSNATHLTRLEKDEITRRK